MRRCGAIVVGCLAACGAAMLAPACAEFTAGPSDDAGAVVDGAADVVPSSDGGPDASEGDGSNGDAAGSCPAQSCTGRTGCTLHTFDAGACDPFVVEGQDATTTHECSSGKMHIAADDTQDLWMTATFPTPTAAYRLRVAFRLSVADWDGRRALEIEIAGNTFATLRIDNFAGTMRATHCKEDTGTCVTPTVDFAALTEHLFVYDIDDTTTRLTVDCVELASFPTLDALVESSNLKVQFGHADAQPLDAKIDDVLVWFTPL